MKNELKLGDYIKPKYGWDKQQKEDFLYMVLPSIVIACLVVAALVVGIFKFIVS